MTRPAAADAPDPSDLGRRGRSPEARLRRKLFRVLRWSEQQEGSGVARFTNGGQAVGDLLLSRGRVCLAIPARACPTERAGALDADLARLVERSRASGRFSATACAAGRYSVERARAGLLGLVARDLTCMLRAAEEEGLQAALRAARDDYEPALTFAPSQVLVACLARTLGPLDGIAHGLAEDLVCDTLLVLARGGEEGEVPYPIAARGLENASLLELRRTARMAIDLGGRAGAAGGALEAVTLREGGLVWHFVGGPRRLVAVRTEPSAAPEALSRAISVAAG